ncbi:MAG: TonB-dependent receptor, partial [Sphingobium sp.]|nr:TonB-dependent receptor [Sphingobium sp.]MBP8671487.1 TonB-dependent receptor [Sphingobium sp.]MBP9158002.1 TonB-dependent receptor [Sphingobium sp.]
NRWFRQLSSSGNCLKNCAIVWGFLLIPHDIRHSVTYVKGIIAQTTGYSALDYMTSVYNNFSSFFVPGVVAPLVTPQGIRLPISNYDPEATLENKQSNFTQEVRVQSADAGAPLKWVIGTYYQNNKGRNTEFLTDPNASDLTLALFGLTADQFLGLPLINGGETYRGTYHTRDKQIALFGQLDYSLTEKLKVTVGARVSKNKFSFTNSADGPINGGPTQAIGQQKETPFTPKVGVSYQLDAGNMVYASYAKGYRIGGANAPIPFSPCASGFGQLGINGAPTDYNSDTTNSYELGSKNRLFGGKVQLATSAYYIKWKNIQQATTVPICGYVYIDNQGEAVSQGFDLQMQARPVDGVQLDVAFGYTDAHYSSTLVQGPRTVVRDGNSLGGPEWTLSLGGQYDFEAFAKPVFIRADWQHAGLQKGLTPAQDPLVPASYDGTIPVPPATDYVTLRTGITFDQLQLALFVDNVLNSSEILTRSHRTRTSPFYGNTSWRPRTYSLIATYRF